MGPAPSRHSNGQICVATPEDSAPTCRLKCADVPEGGPSADALRHDVALCQFEKWGSLQTVSVMLVPLNSRPKVRPILTQPPCCSNRSSKSRWVLRLFPAGFQHVLHVHPRLFDVRDDLGEVQQPRAAVSFGPCQLLRRMLQAGCLT